MGGIPSFSRISLCITTGAAILQQKAPHKYSLRCGRGHVLGQLRRHRLSQVGCGCGQLGHRGGVRGHCLLCSQNRCGLPFRRRLKPAQLLLPFQTNAWRLPLALQPVMRRSPPFLRRDRDIQAAIELHQCVHFENLSANLF